MARDTPIRTEIPSQLKDAALRVQAQHILAESCKRNLAIKDSIDHITIRIIHHPDGAIGLIPVVVARNTLNGLHSKSTWGVSEVQRVRRYFID